MMVGCLMIPSTGMINELPGANIHIFTFVLKQGPHKKDAVQTDYFLF